MMSASLPNMRHDYLWHKILDYLLGGVQTVGAVG